ncbi:unnamed protein product [Ectocarpus sp. 12 AP-2014]
MLICPFSFCRRFRFGMRRKPHPNNGSSSVFERLVVFLVSHSPLQLTPPSRFLWSMKARCLAGTIMHSNAFRSVGRSCFIMLVDVYSSSR